MSDDMVGPGTQAGERGQSPRQPQMRVVGKVDPCGEYQEGVERALRDLHEHSSDIRAVVYATLDHEGTISWGFTGDARLSEMSGVARYLDHRIMSAWDVSQEDEECES